jgi:hypothetical protein
VCAPSVTFLVLTPRDFEFLIKKTKPKTKNKTTSSALFVQYIATRTPGTHEIRVTKFHLPLSLPLGGKKYISLSPFCAAHLFSAINEYLL